MKKLLVICGPTATGKTRLALHLARKFNGELISADSRQVYKHLDIGTGKGLPKSFGFRISDFGFKGGEVGYYTDGDTRIWGYDLVEPDDDFNVSEYVQITSLILENISTRKKLPILVGGTGLYIKGVIDGIPTSAVPKNEVLRQSLKNKNLTEQFELLAHLDPLRSASMNLSDKKNSRRLVRAIEIAEYKVKTKDKRLEEARITKRELDVLFIGLISSPAVLAGKIEKRIKKRLREGIEQEINELFKKGITFESQSMQALGYRQWQGFFQKRNTKKETIEDWIRAEKQYARRQIIWFKRDKRINWFDISKLKWRKRVEKRVERWYKMAYATKN